ncbi:type I restriction-modification system subunit M [Neolewinella antarctica]|uniref:site-specific DNA-methyltransferase (adenine-specific) n=1 Tax=Neolewinella antarctica TaxID=442734 RepID=A0ABX0XG53_9BACT|nr:class I SAM-dependent DNA methyltransferase [Neolewinella antarctica]NJC27861.1 type I restriction enzyme M protein [Neolewinella antarctica]
MALKKSDLYASIWNAADVLRGSMDASQYKDYVLTLLFMKYVTDRATQPDSLIEMPPPEPPEGSRQEIGYGGSFHDMVHWKNKTGVGEQLNKIVARFAAHNGLAGSITTANFNDTDKLGTGQEIIDRLSKLIGIFQKPELDFSSNRAGDDDLLGDAYEYLMRNFATQSGKSKGQFYTPAEVSRVLAAILGVDRATAPNFTVYDPTAGSGSLLLKVADASPHGLTIYGQERDNQTRGMAVMNMWLHQHPDAEIKQGNTLASPQFTEVVGGEERLKRFDFVVANPPFSVKEWGDGFDPESDIYRRFQDYGLPPNKNGDFAFLLHILASLKHDGTAAVILPHGVLFRGNAEATIRQNLLERGYIKAIIGLPANLFYGTGIPACVIVLSKADSQLATPNSVFLIDASKHYRKDGPKNRLRERDIHKIVDAYHAGTDVPGYARRVPAAEIAANDYNLNLPRYLDGGDVADKQDLDGHLRGGIPDADVDALADYWAAFPGLRAELFKPLRPGYSGLTLGSPSPTTRAPATAPLATIREHAEFTAFEENLRDVFAGWQELALAEFNDIDGATKPRELIARLGEAIVDAYARARLVDPYAAYQHLMDYWDDTLQDDVYAVLADGWQAELVPVTDKKGRVKKGQFTTDLLPPDIVRDHFMGADAGAVRVLESKVADHESRLAELLEEHGGEDGLLREVTSDKGKILKAELTARLKSLKKARDPDDAEELAVLNEYSRTDAARAKAARAAKTAETELQAAVWTKYAELTPADVRELVIENKWLETIYGRIEAETAAVAQRLARRLGELATRYDRPLPELETDVAEMQEKVNDHLAKMGLTW